MTRDQLWRAWLQRVHVPGEVSTRVVVAGELRRQRIALARELPAVLPARSAVGLGEQRDLLGRLVSELLRRAAVQAGMWSTMSPRIASTVERAIRAALAMMDLDTLEVSPLARDLTVEQQLGELVQSTSDTTAERVREIILRGLREGQSVSDMQEALIADQGFGPARALAIARTETTRAASAGSVASMREAQGYGSRVRKEWLSARDAAVRDSHVGLDGVIVDVDEPFVVPAGYDFAGASGMAPGAFPQAGMVVNCRCTVIPMLPD